MNEAVIGIGSNIDPEKNVARAVEILGRDFQLVAESAFVRTRPVGYTQQPDF
ncbi:MAG: 2-amino-4-hydroxy-6-hydroxymethyldihydropteridine diphosphokinase, partial [Candidatus Omnitrophica bacterium]|nr:2-amino-4-hydroxy-6-hydroxymethyldihydropteridine diphosphokinase [Candidatus Omnitrophota bacterium]